MIQSRSIQGGGEHGPLKTRWRLQPKPPGACRAELVVLGPFISCVCTPAPPSDSLTATSMIRSALRGNSNPAAMLMPDDGALLLTLLPDIDRTRPAAPGVTQTSSRSRLREAAPHATSPERT